MGSKIIEKHITLDRLMKGTDQAGSLAVEGIERMVRDIRNLELSMGVEDIFIADSVQSARVKLERSIASLKDLKKGHVISESDLHLLSPGDGLKWDERDRLIGQVLSQNVLANEIIYNDFII
jgi:sialic acid synthase